MGFKVVEMPWNDCRPIIEELYNNNSYLTPYQSWDYLYNTGKGFTARNIDQMIGLRARNYVLYDGLNPIAVAPLLENRKMVQLRGALTGAGNLDFIYSEKIYPECIFFLMDEIKTKHQQKSIILERISEKSLSYKYLSQYVAIRGGMIEEDEECFEIKLSDTYEAWFNSLSKNARQNIRTSYNRLASDNKEMSFEFHMNSKIPKVTYKEIMTVSGKRAAEYNGKSGSLITQFYTFAKSLDPVSKYLKHSRNCCSGIIRLDGKIAAMLMGLKSNDGRIIIPRLSYNSSFSRYSPGGILINEVIRYVCSNEMDIEVNSLDLSRGNEAYKTVYGGIRHQNYRFAI